jgi:hypothetical protein
MRGKKTEDNRPWKKEENIKGKRGLQRMPRGDQRI